LHANKHSDEFSRHLLHSHKKKLIRNKEILEMSMSILSEFQYLIEFDLSHLIAGTVGVCPMGF
jgi:hypothetical protein